MQKAFTHIFISLFILAPLLTACFSDDKHDGHDALVDDGTADVAMLDEIDSVWWQRQQDSLSFTSTHHYTKNYNFIVTSDSLVLFRQQPEELVSRTELPEAGQWVAERRDTDSIVISHGDRLVVAEIRILPNDSIDSVWVQLARDQMTFGWIHETQLLTNVVPDAPVSQFISTFSDVHLLWMIIIVALIIVLYTFRIVERKRAKIVHFNDIPSFYPTLLVLNVAFAATLYASIQLFAPEMWRHFYYHPTLNPFSVPLLLSSFLCLVWLMPILALATVDDVRRHLSLRDTMLYLGGLAAVCMVDYLVFTITTLYYIGYLLLVIYVFFSIWAFNRYRRLVYFCGRCGKALHEKGRCPHCGAINE